MVSSTQTQPLNQITGIYSPIEQNFMTANPHICYQWHSRFYEMLNQKFGAPQPLTQCHLVDHNLYRYIQCSSWTGKFNCQSDDRHK